MSDIESECEFSGTPPELSTAANAAILNLLPAKSRGKYEVAYKHFKEWCEIKGAVNVTENVLLAYLDEKSKILKASSLWSLYSMLKATLNVKENIDVQKFSKLVPYLKNKSVGYRAKKSKTFTRNQINTFILEADDDHFLFMKVALIFGISGACRREELTHLTLDDIEDKDSVLIIKIPDSKTHAERTFTITNLDYINIYRRYVALRPTNAANRRLFYKYAKGKCSNQVVGINKVGAIPSLIAKYLKLASADSYTGHSFRRTSATLLANAGADITILKRHGGWKSSTVAEGYIDDSIGQKNKISNAILNTDSNVNLPETNFNVTSSSITTSLTESNRTDIASKTLSGINISQCNNCTITVNISKT